MTIKTSGVGYPRLGERREWKKLLESFWAGKITDSQFEVTSKELRLNDLAKQKALGLDLIQVADYSNYDHVQDLSVAFNVIPARFGSYNQKLSLTEYFALSRGTVDAVASDMTKWFNINYHYTVPEFDNVEFKLLDNRWLTLYNEAKSELGIDGKPVILGPISYLKLGKLNGEYVNDEQLPILLEQALPLYEQIFSELAAAGVQWVQVDEPTLVKTTDESEVAIYDHALQVIHNAAPSIKLELETYFDSIDPFEAVTNLPVDAIGLDFVNDNGENLVNLQKFGFPADKILAAGIVDGHNIWTSNLADKLDLIAKLQNITPNLWIQPSNSLLHVPITTKNETTIDSTLKNGLAFADEKIHELVILAQAVNDGQNSVQTELDANQEYLTALNASVARNNQNVAQAIQALPQLNVERHAQFAERIKLQQANLHLPLLPTTTIGSFPQSSEVRSNRLAWRKGKITQAEYDHFIESETKRWLEIQEDLGLDVLVHGEFERTDMVEYFGEKLTGFYASQNGWVQSYGARGVRPPVIFGDVEYTEPITVKETVFAQSQTDKLVKGMLTAPLTIINWSFVRDDIPKVQVENQIALALREEVLNLEEAGIKIIQVDEPALREGLPLKRRNWQTYLDDAVYSFKITTTGVKDETQIHTHMCYSDFEDIIGTISALDADVISIETSRSRGEIITAFEKNGYDKEIGLGVYDIHSPRVPKVEEIVDNINRALRVIDPKQFWINPDCGLKTRQESETIAALQNMIAARNEVLATLATPV